MQDIILSLIRISESNNMTASSKAIKVFLKGIINFNSMALSQDIAPNQIC